MNRFYVILDDVNQYFFISQLFWGCLHHKLYWLGRILSLVYFLDNIYKNGLPVIAICKNSSCKPNYSTKIITNKNVGLQYNYKWVMSVVFHCCTSLFIFCILFSFDNVFIVWYILKHPVILGVLSGFCGVILRIQEIDLISFSWVLLNTVLLCFHFVADGDFQSTFLENVPYLKKNN